MIIEGGTRDEEEKYRNRRRENEEKKAKSTSYNETKKRIIEQTQEITRNKFEMIYEWKCDGFSDKEG